MTLDTHLLGTTHSLANPPSSNLEFVEKKIECMYKNACPLKYFFAHPSLLQQQSFSGKSGIFP